MNTSTATMNITGMVERMRLARKVGM